MPRFSLFRKLKAKAKPAVEVQKEVAVTAYVTNHNESHRSSGGDPYSGASSVKGKEEHERVEMLLQGIPGAPLEAVSAHPEVQQTCIAHPRSCTPTDTATSSITTAQQQQQQQPQAVDGTVSVTEDATPTGARSVCSSNDDGDSDDDSKSHGSKSSGSSCQHPSTSKRPRSVNGGGGSITGSLSRCSSCKTLTRSASVIGLDEFIEDRREGGTLEQNVVHIEVPFGKPIEEVYDGVHTGPVLGSGISGLVRLVTHKATGLKYAVKVLDLGLVETPTGLQQLREEIFIMCQLDHPNIVRLEEVYESHSEIYLVQELCLGGELFDRLEEQPDYHYTEAECARLVKQMLGAVRYLHSKGIIHRDLKLENFLFSSVSADSELKMIDFGFSKHFMCGEVQHEAVGTPYTVAPEVIRGSYDERCDVWPIGVIAFLLLSGEPPFGGCGGPETLRQVRSNILKGQYEFEPAEVWRHFVLVGDRSRESSHSTASAEAQMASGMVATSIGIRCCGW
jgi:Protein kinase domain